MSSTVNRAAVTMRSAAPRTEGEARFQQRPAYGWFDRWVWRLSSYGPLVAVIASWHALSPDQRWILASVYGLFSAIVLLY